VPQVIPGRVFLDTSVVNFWMDHGQEITEGSAPPEGLPQSDVQDILALYSIYMTAQRAAWQLAISPHTYHELLNTNEPNRRYYLENWFFEIWDYWQEIIRNNDGLPSFNEAERTRVDLLSSGALDPLPDLADRILLLDAIVYRCGLFCTRDRRTIIKQRDDLAHISVPIVTPAEWWEKIAPYASLWW